MPEERNPSNIVQWIPHDEPVINWRTSIFDEIGKPRPVPLAGICDQPCSCVHINHEWLQWIVPAILRIGHSDVWTGTEAEKRRAFDEVNYLIGALMACDCGSGGITTVYNQSEINQINIDASTRYDTYTQTTPELIGAGNASPSTSVDPSLTDNALCAAMHFVAELFRDTYKEASRNITLVEGEWTILAEQQTDVAAKATAIYAATFGVPFPETIVIPATATLIFGIIEEVTRQIEGTTEQVEYTDLGDDWVEDMACYLYTSLSGQEITFNTWRAVALDRSEILPIFVEHTDTVQKASNASEAWITAANDLSFYYGLIEIIDASVTAANASGKIIDCPCCDIIPTSLQSLKMFPVPDNTSNTPWPEYTGHNVFENDENYYIPSVSFSDHSEFPANRVTMLFDPPIRITNDIRLRIIHLGGGAATHTLKTVTNCGEEVTTLAVGVGGGSTNETIFVSLPYLSQDTAELVRRIDFRYQATNGQPLILAYVEIRAFIP